jgi:pyruvate/2-oxoglutarate dehydrogenase complex dihydrolipoamide dehydrogenase (E3) component
MATSKIEQDGAVSAATVQAGPPPADLAVAGRRSAPGELVLPGLEGIPYLTLTTVRELDRVPDHLIILGEGGAGVELGRRFRRAGGQVTIVQRSPQSPSGASDDAEGKIAEHEGLRREGIVVVTEAAAVAVAMASDAQIQLVVRTKTGVGTITATDLLIAGPVGT